MTRSNRWPRDPGEALRSVRKELKLAIRRAKAKCWAELVKSVDHDPWGKPYRVVMRNLRGSQASGQLEAEVLERAVDTLFPTHPPLPPPEFGDDVSVEEFTPQKVADAVARVRGRNTAPGPDAIPNRVWGFVNDLAPDWIQATVNRCLLEGEFPTKWK